MTIILQVPLSLVGVSILLINIVIYTFVSPLTFFGRDMTGWNVFHKIMITLGLGLIIIGFII